MSLPRLFVPSPLAVGHKVTLDAAASHHVLQVLRLRPTSSLVVFNNTGNEYQATLESIDKNKAIIAINGSSAVHNESPLAIHLGQGVSRGEKMDFTIQKAVELGVTTITPLFTEYCNVKLSGDRLEKRLQHWQNISISATEPSGRCYIPKILPGQDLISWCRISHPGLRLILDPNVANKLINITEHPTNVTILVGPEGGLSEEETIYAKENHFLPVNLGPRILRTETAALVAISVIQTKWGDMGRYIVAKYRDLSGLNL